MAQVRIQISDFQAGVAYRAGYVNHRGGRGVRRFLPKAVLFGATDHHPEPQWLLEAYDLDKQAVRTFALKDFDTDTWRRDDGQ